MAGPAYGTNVGLDFTVLANTSMAANQFKFVSKLSTGFLALAGADKRCIGVLQDNPVGTAAQPVGCEVRTGGTTKILCGGTFSAGDLLASDSSGRAVKYTGGTVFTGTPYTLSGSQVLGVALESGSVGIYSSMLFQPSGLAATGN